MSMNVHDVDLADVLDALNLEQPHRKKIRCPNPAHPDHHPSCGVAQRDGVDVWHCYVCGAGGTVVDLVRYARDCSVGEAMSWLTATFHLSVESISRSRPRRRTEYDKIQEWYLQAYYDALAHDGAVMALRRACAAGWPAGLAAQIEARLRTRRKHSITRSA